MFYIQINSRRILIWQKIFIYGNEQYKMKLLQGNILINIIANRKHSTLTINYILLKLNIFIREISVSKIINVRIKKILKANNVLKFCCVFFKKC